MPTTDEQLLLEMLADPERYTSTLRRVHDAVLAGKRPPGRARRIISESWERSLAADVNPDAPAAPVVYSADAVADLRESHVLRAALPMLRRTLVEIADSAQHIVVLCNADGVLFWADGAAGVRRTAEEVALVEGALCTESSIGTTAIGAALALDQPVQIHSAEHLARMFHGWTCAASPLHDPDSGDLLGVLGIGAPVAAAHPSSAMLVSTTAQLVEHQMRVAMIQRDAAFLDANHRRLAGLRGTGGALLSSSGRVLASEGLTGIADRIPVTEGTTPLDDGREGIIERLGDGFLLRVAEPPPATAPAASSLSLTLLGPVQPSVTLDGRRRPLTYRHAEILTLLALHPAGLTSDQLTSHLYGETGTHATTRAEIHRLRAQLGPVLATRPYQLRADVSADLLTVHDALRSGDVHDALAAYPGPLLPSSEAPGIRAERDELHAAVRRAALDHGSADELWRLAETDSGRHDLELLDATYYALPEDDPRRAIVAARANQVLTDE